VKPPEQIAKTVVKEFIGKVDTMRFSLVSIADIVLVLIVTAMLRMIHLNTGILKVIGGGKENKSKLKGVLVKGRFKNGFDAT
tara:strand:- start:444 stop:689 length:246 start_codon:yes stop_codon:yes gene_type:complete